MLKESFQASLTAFEDLLSSLPSGLEDTYIQILECIPKDRRPQARILLQIIVAAYRPLTLYELNLAWSVHPGDKVEDDVLDRLQLNMSRTLHALLGCFVRIIDKIYLIHQTAKEFLILDPNSEISRGTRFIPWFQFELVKAHLVVVQRCLWYLLLEESETVTHSGREKVANTNIEYPEGLLDCIDVLHAWHEDRLDYYAYIRRHRLVDYVLLYWEKHYIEAKTIVDTKTVQRALSFENPRSNRFKVWIFVTDNRHIYFSSFTIGHQAQVRRHQETKRWIVIDQSPTRVEVIVSVASCVSRLRTLPISHAVNELLTDNFFRRNPSLFVYFYSTTEKCLARIKSKIHQDTAQGNRLVTHVSTLLRTAVNGGHEKLLSELIGGGAEINCYNQDGKTPLYLAVDGGYDKMVLELIESGADPNCSDADGKTPLHIAASKNYAGLMHQLIHNGAEVDPGDRALRSPLHVCCSEKPHGSRAATHS